MKVFFSSSFSVEDKPIVDIFRRLLESKGIEVFQATNPYDITEGIIKNIKECELYCSILTPREKDIVSSAVSFEIGVALSHGKNAFIFREDSLPVQTMYPSYLQKPFNSKKLINNDQTELEKIITTIEDLLKQFGYEGVLDDEIRDRYNFAKEQSQILGVTVMRYFNDIFYPNLVKDKDVKNFPTEADITANNIMMNAIHSDRAFRRDQIISEEDTKAPSAIRKILSQSYTDYVWVIDPLDGTLNFAYKFPFFGVSIGLIKDGEPVFGVIYNPTTQEIYCGAKNTHSECINLKDGTKRLLKINSYKKELEDCILMTHLSSKEKPRKVTIDNLNLIANNCRSIRILGSGQMAMLSIAQGQFDIFFNYSTNIWDVVPVSIILKGAGGYVTTSLKEDNSWDFNSKGVLAACNIEIGQKIRQLLHKSIPEGFPEL